ncbi:MAG: hypothetical protein CMN89_05185 [Sutterellaceae bacterium]|uniref:nuclear transport factor 2 family protein n=1 Tax=Limnobacter sp. UBA7229 TaxID=1946762 RepID=UPI000C59DDD8|nr:nuclear transport factor 2 family protein [Limnobacter sp. UBA7229]MAG81381.1 hypothetical protein [Sutterellaceae bacterium]MBT83864.1 hypothetical protein [Sutterellaceae bacterium]|tara:strand:+ start:38811 stop:39323 length:513 start_codon:yes stop_codon:yes gene_type:complete
MESIEKRIQRLEDRFSINDLVAQYFMSVDVDDYDVVGSLFCEDSEFSAGGFPGACGRQEIVNFLRESRNHMAETLHTANALVVHFDSENVAHGTLSAHVELGMAGETYYGAVRYLDEYEKCGDHWKFKKRDMRVVHVAPWSEVGKSMIDVNRVKWPGIEALPSDYPRKDR